MLALLVTHIHETGNIASDKIRTAQLREDAALPLINQRPEKNEDQPPFRGARNTAVQLSMARNALELHSRSRQQPFSVAAITHLVYFSLLLLPPSPIQYSIPEAATSTTPPLLLFYLAHAQVCDTMRSSRVVGLLIMVRLSGSSPKKLSAQSAR